VEAQAFLTPAAVVVVPLGAAAKEHGPHLRLNNDWLVAEYLKQRVLALSDVVIAPTLAYNYYPAFVEYPGSISLRLETARDLMVDICTSLAAFGPKRFYVLNTGVSTVRPLQAAAHALAAQGIRLHYTDILAVGAETIKQVEQQPAGTHADEIETSIMLHIAPHAVDMQRAQRDIHCGAGRLTRTASGAGIYSPSGIYGDATLATRDKGERIVEAMVRGILDDIERLRALPL
jgi:creatinine amidohydrolase